MIAGFQLSQGSRDGDQYMSTGESERREGSDAAFLAVVSCNSLTSQ